MTWDRAQCSRPPNRHLACPCPLRRAPHCCMGRWPCLWTAAGSAAGPTVGQLTWAAPQWLHAMRTLGHCKGPGWPRGPDRPRTCPSCVSLPGLGGRRRAGGSVGRSKAQVGARRGWGQKGSRRAPGTGARSSEGCGERTGQKVSHGGRGKGTRQRWETQPTVEGQVRQVRQAGEAGEGSSGLRDT